MPLKVDTNYFIDKAKSFHGELYDYSKSEYISTHVKLIVICSIHGEFKVSPANHIRGSGCPTCSGKIRGTTEKFIKEAKTVHGDKYNYDKVDYKNNITKVIVNCPKHGDFKVIPTNHISKNKTGCPNCGLETAISKITGTTEKFIKKAREVHGDKYNYDDANYKYVNTKLIVNCPLHGAFEIAPYNHLRGRGCMICGNINQGHSKTDFKARCKDGLGILYLIRCYSKTENFYKVGISSSSIEDRYKGNKAMPYKYEVILDIKMESDKVYDLEKEVLKDFYRFQYQPDIMFKGYTECISIDTNIINYIKSRVV